MYGCIYLGLINLINGYEPYDMSIRLGLETDKVLVGSGLG